MGYVNPLESISLVLALAFSERWGLATITRRWQAPTPLRRKLWCEPFLGLKNSQGFEHLSQRRWWGGWGWRWWWWWWWWWWGGGGGMRMSISISISIVILSFTSEATCSIVEFLAFAFAKQNLWKQRGRSTDRDFSRHPKALLRNTFRFRMYITECLGNVFFPGDSIRALFIPDRWRSPTTPWKGHVNSPSQKGHELNHQVPGFLKSSGTGAIIASPGATPALAVPGGYRFHWYLGFKHFKWRRFVVFVPLEPSSFGFCSYQTGSVFFSFETPKKNPPEMMKWWMFFWGWDILKWKVSGERELTATNW